MRESILACEDPGEASWAPCVSHGFRGMGVGQEVSDSPKKAELKLLWRRALPAAAPKVLLGKRLWLCSLLWDNQLQEDFKLGGGFVCSFLPFFFFNVDCCVAQNEELLSARQTSLVSCFHTLSCCASAYSHFFLLPSCRLENQLLHRKSVYLF